jgi:hypothetical protein
MKMKMQELAEIVSGRVVGDAETEIERIGDLEHAREGEIAYVERSNGLATWSTRVRERLRTSRTRGCLPRPRRVRRRV